MEKLWTIAEVARFLGVSEADVACLVQEGKLTGYKLAGQFVRFKPEQVQELRRRGGVTAKAAAMAMPVGLSWMDRARDFVYFYDFYLLSFLLLTAVVLYLISAS